jgi:hypothetical protein
VQTEAQHAAIRRLIDGGSSMALALMLLPVRSLAADRKYLFALIVLLSGVAATAGLTGCGYKRQCFFGVAPQTYNITITSGTIQHSVNVTLNVQ